MRRRCGRPAARCRRLRRLLRRRAGRLPWPPAPSPVRRRHIATAIMIDAAGSDHEKVTVSEPGPVGYPPDLSVRVHVYPSGSLETVSHNVSQIGRVTDCQFWGTVLFWGRFRYQLEILPKFGAFSAGLQRVSSGVVKTSRDNIREIRVAKAHRRAMSARYVTIKGIDNKKFHRVHTCLVNLSLCKSKHPRCSLRPPFTKSGLS